MSSIGKFVATVALVSGCSTAAPRLVPPPAPPVRSPLPTAERAPPLAPFSFGKTDPARKLTFDAVRPRLDEIFQKKLEETGATGLAAGILLDGELVYARGFGVTDVESRRPVDENTVFRIASVTKGFTALGAMKLRDEGKLVLDEPVRNYLPELAALSGPTRDSPSITARLLLTNASGLAYDDLWGAETYGLSDAELMGKLRSGATFTSAPGTQYAYSNLGWALLGQLIGSVSGTPFRDYLRANVFVPLGMLSTVWEAKDVPLGRLATGYHRESGELVVDVPAPQGAFVPAGGLYTSLHDLTRYVAFHALAYPPRDAPEEGPVRRSTLREMHQGQRLMRWSDKNAPIVERTDDGNLLVTSSYGFGWLNTTTCSEEGRVSHGGYEPGYFAIVTLMPESGVAFALLSTTAPAVNPVRAPMLALLREAGLLGTSRPEPRPGLLEARSGIQALLGAWDDARLRAIFDPDSLKFWWNTHLREDFAKLRAEHGACRPDGELTVYGPLHADFRVACDRGAIRFDLLLAPGRPERLQNVHYTTELPVDARVERAFARWLELFAAWKEPDAARLFGPAVARERARKTLARLAFEHGTCKAVRGYVEVVHESARPATPSIRYELVCTERPLELEFTLDAVGGTLASFSAHPPRSAVARCWD